MQSSKVLWLQKMGVEVWQFRTVDRVSRGILPDELPQSRNRSATAKLGRTNRPPGATNMDSVRVTRNQVQPRVETSPQPHGRVQITVSCSFGSGLLLLKDDDALDRDFTEDIFRAYQFLKHESMEEEAVTFFPFIWPTETATWNIRNANDESLDGARRAFLTTTKSFDQGVPKCVIAIGQQAVQLSSGDQWDEVRVLACLDAPDTIAFKNSLWAFLRDVQ